MLSATQPLQLCSRASFAADSSLPTSTNSGCMATVSCVHAFLCAESDVVRVRGWSGLRGSG